MENDLAESRLKWNYLHVNTKDNLKENLSNKRIMFGLLKLLNSSYFCLSWRYLAC